MRQLSDIYTIADIHIDYIGENIVWVSPSFIEQK